MGSCVARTALGSCVSALQGTSSRAGCLQARRAGLEGCWRRLTRAAPVLPRPTPDTDSPAIPCPERRARRRSYGRVYKGRWRSGTVAIKVIAHDGSVASQISGLRESLLCKNITHPNVVRAPRRPPGAPARARPRDRRGPCAPATGACASSHGRCRPGVCPRRPRLPAEAHLSRRPAGTKQPQPHPRRACVGGPAVTRAQSRPSADAALPCARADLSVSEVSRNGGRHKARTAIPRHLRYPLPQPYPPRRAGADIQGAHDPRGHALGGQHEPGGQR